MWCFPDFKYKRSCRLKLFKVFPYDFLGDNICKSKEIEQEVCVRVFDPFSPWNLDGDLPKVAGFLQGWVSGRADLEAMWQSMSSGVSTTL